MIGQDRKIGAWRRAPPPDLRAMAPHAGEVSRSVAERLRSAAGRKSAYSPPELRGHRTRSPICDERLAVRGVCASRRAPPARRCGGDAAASCAGCRRSQRGLPGVSSTRRPSIERVGESVQDIGVLVTEPNATAGPAAEGIGPAELLHRRSSASTDHGPGPDKKRNRQDRSWA